MSQMSASKHSYSRDDIEAEYNLAAQEVEEFKKVKWASQEKMLNRFYLAITKLPFATASNWLDVGCGTGAFQALVRARYPHVGCLAIDLSGELIKFAQIREDNIGVQFLCIDFMELGGTQLNLITSIGVLQKTNFSINDFFHKVNNLLLPGGIVFVDTKHIGWEQFQKTNLLPERDIQWFNLEELIAGVEKAKLQLLDIQGFLPGKGQIVPPSKSHTIFLIARKI
jgi:cyclopropane fatty-acyl-phospholipid synthase-like methyltransferase